MYEYDAWNRLTSISTTGGSPTLVAEYRYNGLGQRITEGDGTDTEHLVYDDRWRLISRHDGTSDEPEETLDHPQDGSKRRPVRRNWRRDVLGMIRLGACGLGSDWSYCHSHSQQTHVRI